LKARDKVIEILQNYPKTRNNDNLLIFKYWAKFHGIYEDSNCYIIPKDKIFTLTNPETIIRMRAHIQNDLKILLPTDPAVRRKRGQREEEFRAYFKQVRRALAR